MRAARKSLSWRFRQDLSGRQTTNSNTLVTASGGRRIQSLRVFRRARCCFLGLAFCSSPRVKVLFLYRASSPLLSFLLLRLLQPPPASASCSRLLYPPHSFSLPLRLGSGPPAADPLYADTPDRGPPAKYLFWLKIPPGGAGGRSGATVLLLQPALF